LRLGLTGQVLGNRLSSSRKFALKRQRTTSEKFWAKERLMSKSSLNFYLREQICRPGGQFFLGVSQTVEVSTNI
jgi:hypothetical protein